MNKSQSVYENQSLRKRADLLARRAKIADTLYQIVLDAAEWNRLHPEEKPLEIDLELAEEVAARCITLPQREA